MAELIVGRLQIWKLLAGNGDSGTPLFFDSLDSCLSDIRVFEIGLRVGNRFDGCRGLRNDLRRNLTAKVALQTPCYREAKKGKGEPCGGRPGAYHINTRSR